MSSIALSFLLTLKDEGPWLDGEIIAAPDFEDEKSYGIRLNMKEMGVILLEDEAEIVNIKGADGEPEDPLKKWAFQVMRELGAGCSLKYPSMQVGASISGFVHVDCPPPA